MKNLVLLVCAMVFLIFTTDKIKARQIEAKYLLADQSFEKYVEITQEEAVKLGYGELIFRVASLPLNDRAVHQVVETEYYVCKVFVSCKKISNKKAEVAGYGDRLYTPSVNEEVLSFIMSLPPL